MSPQPSPPSPIKLETLHVLAVDDHVINRDFLKAALAGRLGDLQFAGNGHEALEKLAGHDFDLVLMDLHMPDMDGLTTWQRFVERAGSRPIPRVIALTADTRLEERTRLRSAGFHGFLGKPVGIEELLDTMRRVAAGDDSFRTGEDEKQSRGRLLDDERALRANGQPALARSMREALAAQVARERGRLDALLVDGEDDAAAEVLHQWKGGCGYAGANRLEQACAMLEHTLRRELDSSPGTGYVQLLRTLEATLAAIALDREIGRTAQS
ncbi:MAG: response regulator [Wenzhouxiangellaceae bacterium]|nr:response regulator [Wenzhouxiangellaceae bacterium]